MKPRFHETPNGVFMAYRRPTGDGTCRKKLCLTSTDRDVLVATLEELARRPDCWYAKYSVRPRAGMYLGRCFFDTEEAVGNTWAHYKAHPRMFCQVQDDTFTATFRTRVRSWEEDGT